MRVFSTVSKAKWVAQTVANSTTVMVWNGPWNRHRKVPKVVLLMQPTKDRCMEKISTVGLDLAKSVFQVHAIAETGEVLVRRTLRRSQVLAFFSKLAPCHVGLEACGSAHAWVREIAALCHNVKMMPPASVKPLRLAPQDRRR
jgi:hypothetical protein